MNYYSENDPYAAQWLRNLIDANLIPKGEVDERSIVDVAPADLSGFTQCHFFAGIGGWSIAARLSGWPDDRPLWTGSPPCQPFSVAGQGKAQADDRHLWPHLFRLASACRPAVLMGEQVAAAVGRNWLDGAITDLEGIDYACRAVVVPACSVNAPHRRDRLWFVGHPDNQGSQGQHWNVSGTSKGRGEPGRPAASSGVLDRSECAWSGSTWISGHDGKRRRAESKIRLLAYGVPSRSGRLRAYGNAITVPLATQVIASYMEMYP